MKHTLIAVALAAALTATAASPSLAAEYVPAYNAYTAGALNDACTILIEEPYDRMETYEVVSASHTCGRPIVHYLLDHGLDRDEPDETTRARVRCAAQIVLDAPDPSATLADVLKLVDPICL